MKVIGYLAAALLMTANGCCIFRQAQIEDNNIHTEKAQPNTGVAFGCDGPKEVMEVTKVTLGANCESTQARDLTLDESFGAKCNGTPGNRKKYCTLQNPLIVLPWYIKNDMNVCNEAELDIEYLCGELDQKEEEDSKRKLQGSASFPPFNIEVNCEGGRKIDIDTCSNDATNVCQGKSSCKYTITPANSPECVTGVYYQWNCKEEDSKRRLQRHGNHQFPVNNNNNNFPINNNNNNFPISNNNGGNSGSFAPQYINANCGGRRIAINTCSNGAINACQGQYSCSYTITPQNSPECGSSVYQNWYCY